MSVIVTFPDGKIYVFSKVADSVMKKKFTIKKEYIENNRWTFTCLCKNRIKYINVIVQRINQQRATYSWWIQRTV